MRLHRWAPVLLLSLLLAVGDWPRVCLAVDVGEAEESAASCPNVTTVAVPSSSSNSTKTSTSTSSSSVEITDASTCESSVVRATTSSAGVKTLDLRHRDIAAVESLPAVDIVRLDNNQLRSFTTVNNISQLYITNNSITTIDEFEFPEALTLLDLANNALGDIDGAGIPSTLQYLNLSGNPIGSLSNVSFPSSLLQLDVIGSSVATLENFSFPSSMSKLNFSNNPITIIRGVIFPDSLSELTLIATSNPASAATGTTTASTASVVTPEEARALQTAANPAAEPVSVLEEFEVRQSDADRFEKLTLWEVSTTSTLSCSDSNANPRYVQDTMLCVLSDSEFADKYESVVIAASSGSRSGSMWGTDTSSAQEEERIALKETLHQRRSWFLIGAAALLSAFTILMFVNTLCMCLRRKVRGGGKAKASQPAMAKTASGRSNNFWHESASMEPDDEVRHLLCSDPPSTDENSSQPEPELTVDAENDSVAKRNKPHDPLLRLQQELPRSEVDASLVKHRELLAPLSLELNEAEGNDSGDPSSPFVYFKAAYRGKTVVLKTLSIASRGGRNGDKRDNTLMAELWGFVEEIRLSATLSHPQLVAFYGFVKMTRFAEHSDTEGVALVMEFMGKGDLNSFIQSHKRALEAKKTERPSRDDSLDKRESDDDDYDIDALHSEDDDSSTLADSGNRWNWRSSSSAYKSKLSIAIEVAQAVQYLHSFSQPLFHGNLSSRKVFLDSDWNVKLGDLTCCSALRRWSSSHNRSDIGSLPSTTGSATRFSGRSNTSSQNGGEEVPMDMSVWTAPEVLDGRQYTPKADIYSFGVLLAQLATYECTSAEHSVMDDTEVPMLNNNHKGGASGDTEAPTPVRLLMFRCQAFQPEGRPTADELLEELHEIERELTEKVST